ncbi:hypothetical protein HETIRDRAFT_41733 [Heterobasidion irregulare TC 32-1]|uniref:U3 small nucleolar RNA-associated protein 11 n=1 Tax=Heterobasidion irregulare (strain TC 32-1) TaxID=747525 RepID=W4KMY4_HETIT|nr:uncharacterized protein HETIRDRAFT_41733 [Heterobasidion irregulare TC 32-1]ETW87069.1 hypothetical protein HETIRDRAFT_41733 [Heterobasidion irregulare TC 32-1]
MSSSIRNSLHRRNHKERSQLAHRTRLGILEKHKDYVLRARDYHSKQDRIIRLKQKAADRNKDEFYFSMKRQRTEGGVHVQDRGNVALPADMVKVLKSQDEAYIRTMRAMGMKKIEKLKSQLSSLADLLRPGSLDAEIEESNLDEEELEILREVGLIAGPSQGRKKSSSKGSAKHIIFAVNAEEAQQHATRNKRKLPSDNTAATTEMKVIDLGWRSTMQKKGKTKADTDADVEVGKASLINERREATEHRGRLLKELSARLIRDRMLRYAERELEMQRLLMGKGGSKKLKGVEKVEEDDEDDEDDDIGTRSAKAAQDNGAVDKKAYKPRVYKWRVERKR